MTCEQIEYCGSCKHFGKCMKLAKEGRLCKCKITAKSKK